MHQHYAAICQIISLSLSRGNFLEKYSPFKDARYKIDVFRDDADSWLFFRLIRGEEAEWKSCQPVSLVCRIFQPPTPHPTLLFYQLHRGLLLLNRLKLTGTRPCFPCYINATCVHFIAL